MDQFCNFPQTIKGALNFAADRSDGGVFSNSAPEAVRQSLVSVEVDIRNIRLAARRPTLQQEGLTLADHPGGEAKWSDAEWMASVYTPSCVELVKRLTGARNAMSMHPPMLRRTDRRLEAGESLPAQFIHMDQTREAGRELAMRFAAAHGHTCNGGAIYNVWKAITPAPQDIPLAIGDWRTASANDHVIGRSYEPVSAGRDAELDVPYVLLAQSDEEPDWYYVPDLTVDESLVFVGIDTDPNHPLGCPHSAFVQPDPDGQMVRRASLEARVIVFD